jgi:hypothetical protein
MEIIHIERTFTTESKEATPMESIPVETFVPGHPEHFKLLEAPVPLANPNDPYWITLALHVSDGESYTGILIYASAWDYRFYTLEEARTLSDFLLAHLYSGEAKH